MNEKFLFDTSALSSLTQEETDEHDKVLSKFSLLDESDAVYASIASIYEMEYGARHAKYPNIAYEMRLAIQSVKNEFDILPLTEEGAKIFADIKEQYREKKGIGKKALIKHNVDLMIAATAIEIGAILVTNDTKDKIPEIIEQFRSDFHWQDWTKYSSINF